VAVQYLCDDFSAYAIFEVCPQRAQLFFSLTVPHEIGHDVIEKLCSNESDVDIDVKAATEGPDKKVLLFSNLQQHPCGKKTNRGLSGKQM